MKKLLFILLVISLFACSDSLKDRKTTFFTIESLKEHSKFIQTWKGADSLKRLELEYGIYHDKKHIPASVIEYLSKDYPTYRDDFQSEWNIANPDEDAQLGCTSLNADKKPKRKLIALAKGEDYCAIYYLQSAGIGVYEEIMIFHIQDDKVANKTTLSGLKLDFIKTVKKLSRKR